jgi:RecA-family ATPase
MNEQPPFDAATVLNQILGPGSRPGSEQPLAPLPLIDLMSWVGKPIPERDWVVKDRIPRRQVTLHSGLGAVGKSLIELQRSIAHVFGLDWLGMLPEPGPALFIDAEDDDNEMHIRAANILRHYRNAYADRFKPTRDEGADLDRMIAAAVRKELCLMSFYGRDAVLIAPDRRGIVEPTKLYHQLYQWCGDVKPVSITIASAANIFAGNEVDRSQVQQAVSLLTGLAKVANGGLTLIAHPSLTGVNTGTGISGSTQWHNGPRARLYTRSIEKQEEGEQPIGDVREIVFKKNQYGEIAASVRVQYRNGVFVPVTNASPLERAVAEASVDKAFLTCLDAATEQGIDVHVTPGKGYAPSHFAQMTQANGHGSKVFEKAMQRLLDAKKIRNADYGPPSKVRKRLERYESAEG